VKTQDTRHRTQDTRHKAQVTSHKSQAEQREMPFRGDTSWVNREALFFGLIRAIMRMWE